MAKKKKISSNWFKKNIDKKLYYGSIIFTILLFISVAFVYSIPAVGVPIQNQVQISFNDIFWNWTHPPIKLYTVTPTQIYPIQNLHSSEPPIQTSEYTSTNLGISFYYPTFIPNTGSALGGQAFFVREIGNKIYVYNTSNNKPFVGTDEEFFKAGIITNHIDKNVIVYPNKYVELFNLT